MTDTTIGKETSIKIGFAISIIIAAASVFSWMDNRFDAIERRLELIELSNDNRWTQTQQELWVKDLKIRNPTLDIPDVRHD